MKKRTLAKEITFSGIGVHTGQKVFLRLKPSFSGRIIFRRLDLGSKEIELDHRLARAESSSLLKNKSITVRTIEHLLATLYVFGLDSLEIELDGEEIPIGDGSAKPFVELIKSAGQVCLAEEKRIIKVKRPVKVEKNGSWICFLPEPDLKINYTIEYSHPLIGRQQFQTYLDLKKFVEEIAPARTFGFLRDVPSMLTKGLAKGGSFDNALILDDQGLINPPLRFPDEFIRHKVLDLLGDLALAGKPLLGLVEVYRGGHSLHQAGLVALLEDEANWEEEVKLTPSFLV
ncbi:MAG: UDP-3-O-acyl-N-acetylglucosamine deacetylase [Candidatus Aminicenantes bacterium]|nr:UDP-3-O-acyl-N-acetylglucosamine deacetylase [Candidatus Aminicenantes bacterium]